MPRRVVSRRHFHPNKFRDRHIFLVGDLPQLVDQRLYVTKSCVIGLDFGLELGLDFSLQTRAMTGSD